MANFNILILPSNQNSANILFLVYRWCCNRKREQLPVGGELLQATCSLRYQLLELLINCIHHGFTHFQISSMSLYVMMRLCCILSVKNGLKVKGCWHWLFLKKIRVHCSYCDTSNDLSCYCVYCMEIYDINWFT